MSGFLSNLISRSLPPAAGPHPVELLRPRLPSLFEAPGGSVAAPPGEAGGPDLGERSVVQEEPPSDRPERRRPASTVVPE